MNIYSKPFRFHSIIDNENYIKTLGSKAVICQNNVKNSFYFDNILFSFLAYFKLLRRLLRLNRATVKKLDNGSILIIYNYKLLIWKNNKLTKKIQFPFTRSTHNETMSIEGKEIVVGEYGDSGNIFSVGVYISYDFGETWRKKNLMNKGIVRNILSVKYDRYNSEYWVFFGQSEKESRIIIYNKEWVMSKVIGENDFKYRAISSFFFKDHVLWFMNNPKGKSYVIKYNRNNGLIEMGKEFPGPVWYSFSSNNSYFLSTASEENTSDQVYLLSSIDCESWKVIGNYQKDKFNKKYFLYGLLSFPDQEIKNEKLILFGEAIERYDGEMFIVNL